MTELLSVAPQTMTEDEHVIAKGYKQQFGIGLVLVLTLGLAAYFLELKWVVATGCVLIVGAISYCEARLYDLCIRLKRGNHLAHENGEKLAALLNKLDGRMNKLDELVFHIVNAFDIESRSANKTQKETDAVMADLQRLSEGRLPYRGENPASPPPGRPTYHNAPRATRPCRSPIEMSLPSPIEMSLGQAVVETDLAAG